MLTRTTIDAAGTRPSRTQKLSMQKPVGGSVPSILDAPLGFALLRDNRVCIRQKTRALATGGVIVAGIILSTALATRWFGMQGSAINTLLDGIALTAGTLLFGALLVKQLAPRETVSRIRCERYRIIPLKTRQSNQSQTAEARKTHVDPLVALGYAASQEPIQYAVIPRRAR